MDRQKKNVSGIERESPWIKETLIEQAIVLTDCKQSCVNDYFSGLGPEADKDFFLIVVGDF